MSDSAREEFGSAFEAGSYAMVQSVVPSAFGRNAARNTQEHGNLSSKLYPQTAHLVADQVMQVAPANAVTRRSARWPGMAVEIVQANRRGRIDYRYRGS